MIETGERKANRKGFSLAELLVVIAVLGILAGVSFVAVSRYIRNLQALEMDNTAKEIFIAAQNHLSASFASGEYERYYEEYKDTDLSANYGTKLDTKPGYLEGVEFGTEDSVYRYVISNGSGNEGGTKSLILSYMLPDYAIDKEIADNGNYLIVYEVNSATVLAVFYSGKAHTYIGGSHIHSFTPDEAIESGNAYLKDAVNDRSKRVHYRKETEDSIIGCYTAAEKENVTSVTLKPLALNIDNGSKLKVTIENPNYRTYFDSEDHQTIYLKVTGKTSGNSQTVLLKDHGTVPGSYIETRYDNANGPTVSDVDVQYEWSHETVLKTEYFTITLDDITLKNGHFYNKFPYMIPGEQLELEVKLTDDSVFAAPESTVKEDNSLFKSLNGTRAELNNIRHLENLDPDISNLSLINECPYPSLSEKKTEIHVTDAFQSGDLSYSGSKSFVFDIKNDAYDSGSKLKIYKYNGTDSENGYYGISNSNLITYDGCSHSIKNIFSSTGKNGDTGLFSYVDLSDVTKTFQLKNLTVENGNFEKTTGTGNAGGFIAHTLSKAELTKCYLRANGNRIYSRGSGCDAGGFVGKSSEAVDIVQCAVTGTEKVGSLYTGSGIKITSESGNAGGFVGQSSGSLLHVNNSNYIGNTSIITATTGNAGGFAGLVSGTLRIEHFHFTGSDNKISAEISAGGIVGEGSSETNFGASYIEDDTLSVTGNQNAGGLIGNHEGNAAIYSCYLLGESISVEGNENAGGLIGNLRGQGEILSSYTLGENMKVEGTGSESSAGGIIGRSSGGLDIKKTYCTSFVFAGTNAGGFIGLVASGTDNTIDGSYTSGHTRGAGYRNGTEKKSSAYNFNVNAGVNAGGFIGDAEAAVTVTNSYTTASVYASYTSGHAGGFIGKSNDLSVANTYCTGLIDVITGGIKGGFAGIGTVSGIGGNENNYYLKGLGFNESITAAGSGTVTNISETSGDKIQKTADTDAYPWDDELGTIYAYKTVKQLSGVDTDLLEHRGDWAIAEPNNLKLFINNAEKLVAVLSLPVNTLNSESDTAASFMLEGMTSGKKAYMQLKLGNLENGIHEANDTNDTQIISKDTALYNLSMQSTDAGVSEIMFINSIRYNKVVYGDLAYFGIYLDDITEPGLSFASQFSDGFVNGEDIRISARQGFVTWDVLRSEAITELEKPMGQRLPMAGITNSLFADGSGNTSYTSLDHYSDINPAEAIAEVPASASAYSKTALIMNFRHLQNLDTSISDVDSDYTKVKLLKDLYWKSDEESLASGYKAFLDAVRIEKGNTSMPVLVYPYKEAGESSDPEPITVENAFYGIYNPNILDFDGNNKSINNIFIYNKNAVSTTPEQNASAGLFRLVRTSTSETKKIHNLTLIEPVVISENANAGGLIGETGGSGSSGNGGIIDIDYVYVYGKNALVRTLSDDKNPKTGPHAGGLIGYALYGSFYIDNSGASAYVYAEDSRCAGGFIGAFQPKRESIISDCFAGGHVDSSEVYIDKKAISGGSELSDLTTIAEPGGYNVCGYIASGGFIGYIGTDMTEKTLIERCFTTASVFGSKPDEKVYTNKGGAAGGFVGRIHNQYQKYINCYSEGKLFSGTDMLGAFVGHNFNNNNLPESKRPKFENVYVLQGDDYNDDPNLQLVNFGSSTSYDIEGITPVDHDSSYIRNAYPESVKVITFNKNSEEFPYRDTSGHKDKNGLEHTVFYGDWMEPEKTDPVSIDNGNRLKLSVYLKENETYSTELVDTTVYNVTYLRLEGELSKAVEYYKVLFNDDTVILQAIQVGAGWQNYFDVNTGRAVYATRNGNKYLDFYVDNISGNRTNYKGTMQSFWTEPTAGENFTMYVSPTFEGIKTSTDISVTANSLFQKIEKNTDGTDTYTAYIANSRHLMNLNPAISGLGIRVTKAVQTDDIYWADDGTYGTSLYNAEIQPYLTELPDASMYELYKDYKLSSAGKMLSIFNPDITEYDGQIRTMHNFNLDTNYINGGVNAGLFARTTTALTVKNLFFSNTTVGNSDSQTGALASGIIVGNPGAKLTVENIIIYGTTNIQSRMESGGVVGYTSADLTMTNISMDGSINIYGLYEAGGVLGYMDKGTLSVNCAGVFVHAGLISNGTHNAYNGDLGGLIGRLAGVSMEIKNSFASAYIEGSGLGIGGFIGNISDSTCTGTIRNCYASGYTANGVFTESLDASLQGHYTVIAEQSRAVGGFIGNVTGAVTIERCFSTNSVASKEALNLYSPYYIGGFAGSLSGNVKVAECYTLAQIKPDMVHYNNLGLFAGAVHDNVTVGNKMNDDNVYPVYVIRHGVNVDADYFPVIGFDGNPGMTRHIVDGGLIDYSNIPESIRGTSDDATFSEQVYHHDSSPAAYYYPYKNWTDSNGYIENSSPFIVFFGDW